ncbi:MAG: DUF72 domain-containing protein [Bacteroidetes bacterium]|nr:DUF72 domain-containing protein [Bacteroidota bacterium]
MKFGYVDDPNSIDYTLPIGYEFNDLGLKNNSNSSLNIYAGCPNWADKSFVGKVYPAGTSSERYLAEYAKIFNCIELNTTRYGKPNQKTLDSWLNSVDADFTFFPKLPQYISHRRNFGETESIDDLLDFAEFIGQLGQNLGHSFLQLPPKFGPDKLDALEELLKQIPEDFKLALEARHEGFFESKSSFKRLFTICYNLNIPLIHSDTPGRRDLLHQAQTTPVAFIRFGGNKLHKSDYQRIDLWIDELVGWVEKGLQEIIFIPHQPAPVKYMSADLVSYFKTQIINKLEAKSVGVHVA